MKTTAAPTATASITLRAIARRRSGSVADREAGASRGTTGARCSTAGTSATDEPHRDQGRPPEDEREREDAERGLVPHEEGLHGDDLDDALRDDGLVRPAVVVFDLREDRQTASGERSEEHTSELQSRQYL